MSKVRNTEVWHGQLLVISNDWDVKGLVVKVCRVSIGNMEKERERERVREREFMRHSWGLAKVSVNMHQWVQFV